MGNVVGLGAFQLALGGTVAEELEERMGSLVLGETTEVDCWKVSSAKARDLCRRLLKVEATERLSMKDALQHDFIVKCDTQNEKERLDDDEDDAEAEFESYIGALTNF